MAPDRGEERGSIDSDVSFDLGSSDASSDDPDHRYLIPVRTSTGDSKLDLSRTHSELGCYARTLGKDTSEFEGTQFTTRGVFVGILIGILICFSNTYFGLQTGWISGLAMPASLLGFAVFKSVSRLLTLPFTPVENVLVQTVAGAVGTMPLGCGFVGVMPALEFLLKRSEGAPIPMEMWRLVLWSLGICLFGVVFAVPLRKEVIVREKLKFPSGTATALVIGMLHGGIGEQQVDEIETQGTEERHDLLQQDQADSIETTITKPSSATQADDLESDDRADWKGQIRLLMMAFGASATYTVVQYFIPVLHRLPILGAYLADTWLWTLNPSPAYVGQGIIMGPAATFHMLLGAVVGWAILSPLAKYKGWSPGPVSDWETGSKGWIVWISLGIMIADSVINLAWLVGKPLYQYGPSWLSNLQDHYTHSSSWSDFFLSRHESGYPTLSLQATTNQNKSSTNDPPDDAPPHHLVSTLTVSLLLPLSLLICVVCVHITFGTYIPIPLNLLALALALLFSIIGVRALGETDLNPVSGISKLTQLIFALVTHTDQSSPHTHHGIVINLLAGALSESGALQAGDIMQDLKAGHLIGASPKAQFYGQLIGSVVGAVASAAVYKLYVHVYAVPGELFQVPTAYVWIFTARLVTGHGLPPMAWQFALGAGGIFALTTALRIYLGTFPADSRLRTLQAWVPGGIAVAVGMYNTPSFTLARTVGGILSCWWVQWKGREELRVIVLASGLILGEGVMSILTLMMASLGVPHM